MPQKSDTYTYRNGQKLKLSKVPDQYVLRKLPTELPQKLSDAADQMSSQSSRVVCKTTDLEKEMQAARKMAPTHHAYLVAGTGEEFLITDRIIVTFEETPKPEELGTFAGKYALEIVHRFAPDKVLFRLTNKTGKNPVKLVVELTEKDKSVKTVEHDLNMRMKKSLVLPTDQHYSDQWHLHRKLQHPEYDQRSSANCEQAWQTLGSYGDHDVVIGLTDDGCRLDHPDFDSPQKFAGWGYFEGFDLLTMHDPGADPDKMYQAGANHGTACAGVIAAETDGNMTVGAAPRCRLLPIKWQSSGPYLFISDAKLLIAFDYVADKIDVLSNSWGHVPINNKSSDVIDKINELSTSGGRRGKGIVFMWAAGNENCPISHRATVDVPHSMGWENNGSNWEWVGPDTARRFENNFVDVPGVMIVAALASTAQRSHYSNYGTGMSICAPSSNSHAYYRMDVEGLGITTTRGDNSLVRNDFGGTSSATPLVAGIAGLVISANLQLTALEVISVLERTASKDLNMTGYPKTPPASFDLNPSWDVSPISPFDSGDFTDQDLPDGSWSPWFGHGKVDAAAAVGEARQISGAQRRRIRVDNNTSIEIPDRDPTGISSQIYVNESGVIDRLNIWVDIRHTYIGDLVVRLVSPGGVKFDLHRRSGSYQDDIIGIFDPSTTPALAQLLGSDIRGLWYLEVSDHARYDTGRLRSWSVEADLLGSSREGELRVESTPGLRIPDDDPAGISDTMSIYRSRTITDMSVELDITHTWIGDLSVALISPAGKNVTLHSREGRDADDIRHTYNLATEPELAQLLGDDALGDWVLQVSDNQGADIGSLNSWALIFP